MRCMSFCILMELLVEIVNTKYITCQNAESLQNVSWSQIYVYQLNVSDSTSSPTDQDKTTPKLSTTDYQGYSTESIRSSTTSSSPPTSMKFTVITGTTNEDQGYSEQSTKFQTSETSPNMISTAREEQISTTIPIPTDRQTTMGRQNFGSTTVIDTTVMSGTTWPTVNEGPTTTVRSGTSTNGLTTMIASESTYEQNNPSTEGSTVKRDFSSSSHPAEDLASTNKQPPDTTQIRQTSWSSSFVPSTEGMLP